ncbi:helix-turn-helix domain-containing protein [Pseudobdellovibrio sp. HCB154]|uniref:helix-turn-helix domain-containing protein n=1 Tax=Pseudobdellovibrio sp. HCB154 TaxID=3386277 RepID=UPI0039175B67
MSNDFHDLGNYLKEKRIDEGFTQGALAKKLKVHTQFVSNWERGLCAPPSHCFHHVIEVLKLNREHIVEVMLNDSKRIIESKVYKKKRKLKSA